MSYFEKFVAEVRGYIWMSKTQQDRLIALAFSIAHELGHWLAFSHFQIDPQSDRRLYWEHERVMDAFANCLLGLEDPTSGFDDRKVK